MKYMPEKKKEILDLVAEAVRQLPEDRLDYLVGFAEGLAAAAGVQKGGGRRENPS